MSEHQDNKLATIQAQQLTDQILAAATDPSPESVHFFDELTTHAMLHMSNEQWQVLQKALSHERKEEA